MSTHSYGLPPLVEEYLNATVREHPVLVELRAKTLSFERASMQISPSQGAFLAWLVRLLGARRTIEVGVFTGYSSLVTALALPDDGHLLACDVSEEWTNVAREHWQKAGVTQKIELVLAPAIETLDARLRSGEAQAYDFAFIDADKENYVSYYHACVDLVRPGGVLVLDNLLWNGSVADVSDQRESTRALRDVKDRVFSDARVEASLVPVGDGLLLARKL